VEVAPWLLLNIWFPIFEFLILSMFIFRLRTALDYRP
jgi:mannose-6-phosphate isomerase-like protein (cupin superfamily)